MQEQNGVIESAASLNTTINNSDRQRVNNDNVEMDITSITLSSQPTKQDQESCPLLNLESFSNIDVRMNDDLMAIHRWKITTEIEKQHMLKCEREMQRIIENQRKSILELQLENEKLSNTLHEEFSGRELIIQKMESTRNIVDLLKKYINQIRERMIECDKNADKVKAEQEKYQEVIEFTTQELQRLRDVHVSKKNVWSIELHNEKEAKQQFQAELSAKMIEISELQESLNQTVCKLEVSHEDCKVLNEKLSVSTDTCEVMNAKILELDSTKDEMQKVMNEQNIENENLKIIIENFKIKTKDMENHLKAFEDETSAKLIMLSMQLNIVVDEKQSAEESFASREFKYNERLRDNELTETQLKEKIETLISKVQEFESLKAADESKIEDLKRQLLEQMERLNETAKLVNDFKAEKEHEINTLQEQLTEVREHVENLRIENEQAVTKYETEVVQLTDSFDLVISHLKKEKNDLESNLKNCCDEREQLLKDVENLNTEKSNLESTMNEQIDIYKKTVNDLQEDNFNSQITITELRSKAEMNETLRDEIRTLIHKNDEQEIQLKQKQQELADHNAITSQLENDIARLTNARDQAVSEFGNYRLAKNMDEAKLRQMESALREDLQNSNKKISLLMSEAKEESEKWKEEFNNLRKENELLLRENDKIKSTCRQGDIQPKHKIAKNDNKNYLPLKRMGLSHLQSSVKQKLKPGYKSSPNDSEASIAESVDLSKLEKIKRPLAYRKVETNDKGNSMTRRKVRMINPHKNKVGNKSNVALDEDGFLFNTADDNVYCFRNE